MAARAGHAGAAMNGMTDYIIRIHQSLETRNEKAYQAACHELQELLGKMPLDQKLPVIEKANEIGIRKSKDNSAHPRVVLCSEDSGEVHVFIQPSEIERNAEVWVLEIFKCLHDGQTEKFEEACHRFIRQVEALPEVHRRGVIDRASQIGEWRSDTIPGSARVNFMLDEAFHVHVLAFPGAD